MSNKMTCRSNLCIQKIELGELTCALCIVRFTAGMWHRIVMLAKPWRCSPVCKVIHPTALQLENVKMEYKKKKKRSGDSFSCIHFLPSVSMIFSANKNDYNDMKEPFSLT